MDSTLSRWADSPEYLDSLRESVSIREAAAVARVLDMYLPWVADELNPRFLGGRITHGGPQRCSGFHVLVVDLGPGSGGMGSQELVDALEEALRRPVELITRGHGTARAMGTVYSPTRCPMDGRHEPWDERQDRLGARR